MMNAKNAPFDVRRDDTILGKVNGVLEIALKNLYPNLTVDVHVEYPNRDNHGHVSSNVALKLTKELHKNPLEIAQEIAKSLANDRGFTVEVIKPGFLNFVLDGSFFVHHLDNVLPKKQWTFEPTGKLAFIEYGGENIAKSMTVGHLRSNIIGQALLNMYKTLGWNVKSDSHPGDWGTQFGKLIVAYKKWGEKNKIEANPIDELVALYVKFHDEADKDPSLIDLGREEFRKLESGNEENHTLWKWFFDVSMKEFDEMYDKLGIRHDTRLGESFYIQFKNNIVEECLDKKIAFRNEDGSIAIDLGNETIPTFLLIKSDGSTVYHTRDFATLKYRIDEYNPDIICYVVGSDQVLYFKQLFESAKRLGWKGQYEHVSFGMVRLPEGKMSTRKGRNIKLRDLIEQGYERSKQLIASKNVQTNDVDTLVKQLTIGSIKFNDLSQNRTTDITFEWERMLSFEGATAPYLQYAYVRTQSILSKNELNVTDNFANLNKNSFDYYFDSEDDANLAYHIVKFPDLLIQATKSHKPNILAQYLLDLASQFSSYYERVPILHENDTAVKNNRLLLITALGYTLKQGLEILGIECPEKM